MTLDLDPNLIVNVGLLVATVYVALATAGAAVVAWGRAVAAGNEAGIAKQAAGAATTQAAVAHAAEERQRKNDERHQAEMISAWIEAGKGKGEDPVVVVSNASNGAIYEVFAVEGIANKGADDAFNTYPGAATGMFKVPPGRWPMPLPPKFGQGSGMHARVDVALVFRDAREVHWMRDASGRLRRLEQEGWRELELEMPFQWSG